MNSDKNLCGLSFWHPSFLQRFSNAKSFMIVYGLLGTVQAMSYMYFIVTLTTIEKRFKIPSQTTGIILSGNEISQILLSLILSYLGGQRNRPRWIAWGIVFCGLSCFIIALPHFIYGGGEESIKYTQEYVTEMHQQDNDSFPILINSTFFEEATRNFCFGNDIKDECGELITIVPLILIFLSQFVLGIGNTLYYSLGQTYLDDNSKKTNTPLMLALAMSLRLIGPVIGFFLGYVSLNMYIDPSRTPLIDKKDSRWLGAWWFGWIILGSVMLLFSGFIGMFPKELPKRIRRQQQQQQLRHHERQIKNRNFIKQKNQERYYNDDDYDDETNLPLACKNDFDLIMKNNNNNNNNNNNSLYSTKLEDFPKALMRLLKNKLLIYNIMSAIFYILGASGYMTFLSKYMEVQFHKSAQNATIIIGPVTIIGMVFGLLLSGYVISKYKPSTSKVLFWNVIVGFIYMLGQIAYLFLYCGDVSTLMQNGILNLTSTCNANCSCDRIPYSPVCHSSTGTTYFSACHAGCDSWNPHEKAYTNCSCIEQKANFNHSALIKISNVDENPMVLLSKSKLSSEYDNILKPGACLQGCTTVYYIFTFISMIINWFGSSGRIGNILVNYRAVHTQDKSFAQGLALMMLSLFALIPGPIIFGRIIDSTCLIWTEKCDNQGRCQLYDQENFRFYVNIMALSLTIFGVFFDFLVWYYGRTLNLYDENVENFKQKNQIENNNSNKHAKLSSSTDPFS